MNWFKIVFFLGLRPFDRTIRGLRRENPSIDGSETSEIELKPEKLPKETKLFLSELINEMCCCTLLKYFIMFKVGESLPF